MIEILPLCLRIEPGSKVICKEEDRNCELCNLLIENEIHFICNCHGIMVKIYILYNQINIPNLMNIIRVIKLIS